MLILFLTRSLFCFDSRDEKSDNFFLMCDGIQVVSISMPAFECLSCRARMRWEIVNPLSLGLGSSSEEDMFMTDSLSPQICTRFTWKRCLSIGKSDKMIEDGMNRSNSSRACNSAR